jgi:hypothetical protein
MPAYRKGLSDLWDGLFSPISCGIHVTAKWLFMWLWIAADWLWKPFRNSLVIRTVVANYVYSEAVALNNTSSKGSERAVKKLKFSVDADRAAWMVYCLPSWKTEGTGGVLFWKWSSLCSKRVIGKDISHQRPGTGGNANWRCKEASVCPGGVQSERGWRACAWDKMGGLFVGEGVLGGLWKRLHSVHKSWTGLPCQGFGHVCCLQF